MKSEWLSSTSERKECLPRKFMKASWKPLGRNPRLKADEKVAAESKRGTESVEYLGRFGRPKDATSDENVKVVHILLMCDRSRDLQSIASEVGISFGAVQPIMTNILDMSKVSASWVPRIVDQ